MLLVFLLSACDDELLEPAGQPTIPVKGYSYTAFGSDDFLLGASVNAVEDLRSQTGSDWLALCLFEFQQTPTSTDIQANYSGLNPLTGAQWMSTAENRAIRAAIRDARRQGMKVMLKPQVDLYDGQWRGMIVPDREGRWFDSYQRMLLKYAVLAEQHRIELLCIGVEYVKATTADHTKRWQELIAAVRAVYSGQLTYSANWTKGGGGGIPEYRAISFWRELDYVGISFYAPLLHSPLSGPPSAAEARLRLLPIVGDIELRAREVARPVLLTECGIRSQKGALAGPWSLEMPDVSGARVDEEVQRVYYQALLESFATKSWCHGFFWWYWQCAPTEWTALDYTCDGKAAAALLREWYGY